MHLLWIDDNDKAQRNAWDEAHAAARAPLQQHWAYGSALQGFGARVLRCLVMQEAKTLALAQFLVRRYAGMLEIALCTRGPVWLDTVPGAAPDASAAPTQEQRALRRAAHRLIRRELPLHGLRLVLFSPDLADANAAGVDRLQRVMTGYATVLLRLDEEPEVLRQRLPRNWHNRLNAAEASALKVARVGNKPAQYQWLLDREQALQQQRGYRALPKTFIPAYQAAYKGRPGKDDVNKTEALFTLRADLDRTPVAGMMFLRHGDAATYHVGWSDAAQRLPGAHNLLLWQAMLQLRQAGVRRIDLGGVNTGRSAGVARFKIGSGGEVVVLAGTYLAL